MSDLWYVLILLGWYVVALSGFILIGIPFVSRVWSRDYGDDFYREIGCMFGSMFVVCWGASALVVIPTACIAAATNWG